MGIWSRFQNFRIARDQLEAIFALPAQPRGGIADGQAIQGRLDIEDVSFGYQDDAPPVLDGVSLSLRPGEVVGITGNNGSGKTTLLRMIMGVLRPGTGDVRLDGNAVTAYDREVLHRHVAYLPQDAVLFQGSILDNMTLFDPERAGRAKRIAAMLGLSEIIGSLARGYDTEIRDNPEESLPTGISQRIAIVRALASVESPKLIIFDESNSHLDAEGDEALRQLLIQLRGHCTMILVSHRPSYLSLADRIFVLREGRLVASAGGARAVLAELERQLEPASAAVPAVPAGAGPLKAQLPVAIGQRAS
jgi:ATP-binding cassette, subfamily C, bacterial LapB